jgi:hypothetical protein
LEFDWFSVTKHELVTLLWQCVHCARPEVPCAEAECMNFVLNINCGTYCAAMTANLLHENKNFHSKLVFEDT